jgi:sucrose-6-phosphate hydrolase SacC (GH32 family)
MITDEGKHIPEGEQVYYGLSKDGFLWEQVNGGRPIIYSTKSAKGVRDHTICRGKHGRFHIISTDLSLANYTIKNGAIDWVDISTNGSKYLSMWESDDLVNWSEQRLFIPGGEGFGCLWAPEITYAPEDDIYILHWSSSYPEGGDWKAIFYTRTKDFCEFSKPEILYRKEDSGIIDSAMYWDNGMYYLFVKSEKNPARLIMLRSSCPAGPFTRIYDFDKEMEKTAKEPHYEAPTVYQMTDGRWCLLLDYYGVPGEGQGYVPFIADDISTGLFIRSDDVIRFPYGFKHGTVLAITDEEYSRIKKKW